MADEKWLNDLSSPGAREGDINRITELPETSSFGAREGDINPITGLPETSSPGAREGDINPITANYIEGEPTFGEKGTEVGYGLLEGVSRTAPSVAGGMYGLNFGMRVAPLTGPYAPFVVAGSTAVGAIAGYFGGVSVTSLLDNKFDVRFPGVARQDLVPYREGGKVLGDTLGLAPVAFGIPVLQAQRLAEAIRLYEPVAKKVGLYALPRSARFLTEVVAGMGKTAQNYPKSFLTAEAVSGAGAGVGAGVAEYEAPGEPGTRFWAEIAGGIIAPSRFFIHAGSAKALAANTITLFSDSAREGRAANKLYSMLEDAGENIPKVIRELEANVPRGASPTSGQKTGSRVLSIFEHSLARDNKKYGAEIAEQGQLTLRAYELLAQNLEGLKTPAAFREAAQIRKDAFEQMLANREQNAINTAAEKVVKITKDDPSSREKIGIILHGEIRQALSDARGHESFLWKRAIADLSRPTAQTVTERVQVGKMVDEAGKPLMTTRQVTKVKLPSVVPNNTIRDFLDEMVDIAPPIYRKTVPPVVKDVMASMGVTEATIARYKMGRQTEEFAKTGLIPDRFLPPGREMELVDLVNIRSNLLELSRNAAGQSKTSDARFFGNLANNMLNDLDRIKSPVLDEARSFSKTLNDYFTRSFAGEMLGKKGKGTLAYPPEVLVQRAFGANNDLAAMRMAEMEDAVGMLGKEYTDAVAKFGRDSAQALNLKPLADLVAPRVTSVLDAQTRILRLAAAETIDASTGRISPTRLSRFIKERKPLLDKLQITDDLSDAVKAENLLKSVLSTNSALNKTLRNQTAFAQVLKKESPSMALADVLNSSFPVKNFLNLIKLAKSGGPDAVEGLKSTLYEYAHRTAGGSEGFSPRAYEEAFFGPIGKVKNNRSVYEIMRSQGLMSLTEGKNLKRIIDPMIRVEQSLGNRQLMDGVVQGADAATELALRVVGSKLGTTVSGQGGASLIAASAGSKYIRQIFDKSPMMLVRGVFEEAAKNPPFAAMLLRKGRTEGEKLMLAQQMHAYLTAAGLDYSRFEEPAPEPMVQAPPAQTSFTPRRQPATASTRGVPGLNIGGGGPPQLSPGGARAAAPGGGSSRDMLKRLFPFDTTIR